MSQNKTKRESFIYVNSDSGEIKLFTKISDVINHHENKGNNNDFIITGLRFPLIIDWIERINNRTFLYEVLEVLPGAKCTNMESVIAKGSIDQEER